MVSQRFYFRGKAGRDGLTLSKGQGLFPNEAVGCDLEITCCNVYLCHAYFDLIF